MGGRVAGLIPIPTSTVNIKYCYMIARRRVTVIFRPSSTSTISTKMINSTIARERVAGILIPRYTSTIVNNMINYNIARGRVDGLKIPMYMSSTTYYCSYFRTP